jgi:hypothetical protein
MTAQRSKKLRGKRARNRSRFPAWIILMGVAALAAGLVLVMTNRGRQPDFTPKVNGAPALTVDQEVVDYGDVRLGTPLTTEIRVSNVGTETLRFQKAPYVEIKEGC